MIVKCPCRVGEQFSYLKTKAYKALPDRSQLYFTGLWLYKSELQYLSEPTIFAVERLPNTDKSKRFADEDTSLLTAADSEFKNRATLNIPDKFFTDMPLSDMGANTKRKGHLTGIVFNSDTGSYQYSFRLVNEFFQYYSKSKELDKYFAPVLPKRQGGAMNQLEKLTDEIRRLFDLFNEHYYAGELARPVITIQTNGRERRVMGWCTCDKVWKDHTTGEYYYEITICSEYLYRDVKEICSTLLHEMVHLYCQEKGIKDTSRSNTYHNKRFKEMAESHGLIVTYDEKIGWSSSQLTPEAMTFVEENADKDVFVVTRNRHSAPKPPKQPTGSQEDESGGEAEGEPETGTEDGTEPEKPKQSLRKYVCPKCGCIIRASKEVNVICGDCKVPFEKE